MSGAAAAGFSSSHPRARGGYVRGSRRRGAAGAASTVADDLEEVAMQVAHAAVDSENSEGSPTKASQVWKASGHKSSNAVPSPHGAPGGALFQLPTPGRSGRTVPPPPAEPANAGTLSSSGFGTVPPPLGAPAPPTAPPSTPPVMPPAAAQSLGAHASALAMHPAVPPTAPPAGPPCTSPSAAQAAAAAAATQMRSAPGTCPVGSVSQTAPGSGSFPVAPMPSGPPDAAHTSLVPAGNYRERLQARGQQAMHRSLHPGAAHAQHQSALQGSPGPSPGHPGSPLATTLATGAQSLSGFPGMSHPVNASPTAAVPPLPSMGGGRMGPAATQPPPPVMPLQAPWSMAGAGAEMQPWGSSDLQSMGSATQVPPMLPGVCPRGQMLPECDNFQMMGCGQQAMMPDCAGASPFGMPGQGQQSPYAAQGQMMSPFSQQMTMPCDFTPGGNPMQQMPMPWEDPMQQMQQMQAMQQMQQMPPMQHMAPMPPQPDPVQLLSPQYAMQAMTAQQQHCVSSPTGSCHSPCDQSSMAARPLNHEEMMAAMQGGFFDREQLAQQLRDAAQCIDSYED
eukprot:TRINITY_DN19903_c0_g1_i1.p1 TRINITY_DN19903_c0_g1~~TRINITY_DN19903_c0_g1_i1.p1  ORF type:complete len:597 (+),score=117.67 TRINITY_DN19903_c0_g1_i1:103-1791(+)